MQSMRETKFVSGSVWPCSVAHLKWSFSLPYFYLLWKDKRRLCTTCTSALLLTVNVQFALPQVNQSLLQFLALWRARSHHCLPVKQSVRAGQLQKQTLFQLLSEKELSVCTYVCTFDHMNILVHKCYWWRDLLFLAVNSVDRVTELLKRHFLLTYWLHKVAVILF